MEAVKKPCPSCPFRKSVKPGALGGSSPDTFVGQLYGPFTLPCHMHCDFTDPGWKGKAMETPQCAGASVLRGYLGLSSLLPKQIPILPPNGEVFDSAVEFYAHHAQVPYHVARMLLNEDMIVRLVRTQLERARKKEAP